MQLFSLHYSCYFTANSLETKLFDYCIGEISMGFIFAVFAVLYRSANN